MRELSDQTIDAARERSLKQNRPMVIDFWGTWCAPCRAMLPILKSIEAEYSDVDFYTVNVFSQAPLAARWMVESVPKILIVKGGVVAHVFGVCTKEELVAKLEEILCE